MITIPIPLLILIVLAIGIFVSIIGMFNAGGAGGGIPFAKAACIFGGAAVMMVAYLVGGGHA